MKHVPFLLRPVGKDYLWGGERLKTEYHKQIDLTPLAETWECSTHPDGCSIVDSGAAAGKPLRTVLQEHPEYLGIYANPEGELPILIKLIDAKKDLSVQVHPDDAYAKQYENGQNGKTEMWYVLEAEPDASLVYGFRHTMTPERLRQSLAEGTLEADLQSVPVSKNDAFLIPAGTVHAIGAGILLAEIQQSSNLTYRLYDYNRTDANGNKRPLHIEKAVATVDYQQKPLPEQNRTVEQHRVQARRRTALLEQYLPLVEELIEQVRARQHDFNNQMMAVAAAVSTTNAFAVLLCISGSGTMTAETGETLVFQKGQCVFLPADTTVKELSGTADLLWITA